MVAVKWNFNFANDAEDLITDEGLENLPVSKDNVIAVMPLGATEQHGPHLPFETDSIIAEGFVNRLIEKLNNKKQYNHLNVVFLPVEEVTYSVEHLDYKGSKSKSYQEAIEHWVNRAALLKEQGINKLLFLNAHGGNSPLMTIAALEMRVRHEFFAVSSSWTRFPMPKQDKESLFTQHELEYGIHGGAVETSLILALKPDFVNLDELHYHENLQEVMAKQNKYLRAYGKHAYGWKAQDLNTKGVVGDPRSASAEKGLKILDHVSDEILILLDEIADFSFEEKNENEPKMLR
jgi:creatinine amidohydrolase